MELLKARFYDQPFLTNRVEMLNICNHKTLRLASFFSFFFFFYSFFFFFFFCDDERSVLWVNKNFSSVFYFILFILYFLHYFFPGWEPQRLQYFT